MDENTKNQSISNDLAITIAKSGGIEFPAELLEFTIDQVIDEGIWKDLPFVGWIAKGVSISRSISDRIFHHKVLRFLIELENINNGNRDYFRENIESDPEFRRKVGEHLIVILNKIDAFDKTSLLAKCFDHYLTKHINYEYFVDLSYIIERSLLGDLKSLCVPSNEVVKFSSDGIAVACGLMEFGIADHDFNEAQVELGTRMSKFGRDLRDIFLGRLRGRVDRERRQREALFGKDDE
ncbi:hypothetical protein KO528_15685 [Saccharophagus degradans]|uniref:hypothetical protein n=1 Tax=Saccharophagus degradans TaxID=86304 RepID=UPI001C088556|nr:hypothetical protein [Saccharophagus degradans]MBU2986806.1 hypothetical protein [Saccharophagus degradans]